MTKNNTRVGAAALLLLAGTAAQAAGVEITGARAELREGAPRTLEVYFTLRNATGHELKLVKMSSPAGDALELKQRSLDAEGRTRLWPVAKFEVPVGGTLRFVPEGRLLQIASLASSVRVGETVPLTLTFEDEAPVTLQLSVAAPAKL
ncbi:MAG: copper chaperone PCu(A)C [Steroidobacteraceae bacterium]